MGVVTEEDALGPTDRNDPSFVERSSMLQASQGFSVPRAGRKLPAESGEKTGRVQRNTQKMKIRNTTQYATRACKPQPQHAKQVIEQNPGLEGSDPPAEEAGVHKATRKKKKRNTEHATKQQPKKKSPVAS